MSHASQRTLQLTDDVIAEIGKDLPVGSAFSSFSPPAQHMQLMSSLHKEHKSHKAHEEHTSHMLHDGIEPAVVSSCSTISTVEEAYRYADTGTCHENCVFRLAKCLWSLAQDGIIDADDYDDYVEKWHRGTEAEFHDGFVRDKTLSSTNDWFSMKIDKIKLKMGEGKMAEHIEEARTASDPPEAARFDCPISRWLLRLCIIMQREGKDGTFFMTCRAPAGPMGVTHNIINMKLKTFCRFGLLRLVKKGGREKGQKPMASQYQYLHPPF